MRLALSLSMLTATLLAVPGSAAANGTGTTSKNVVTASANVSSCGSLSGMTMSWTSTANVVTTIVLGSIPANCNGATLKLTLVGASNSSLGTAGPATISGTPLTLSSISGTPTATATSVTGAYVSVVGP